MQSYSGLTPASVDKAWAILDYNYADFPRNI